MNDLSILVSSCDPYQDVWEVFIKLFFRYWPDCPYQVYFLTNHLLVSDSRIRTIAVGEDIDWSTNCRVALKQLSAPYVLFMMEDCPPRSPVDSALVGALLYYLRSRGGACLRVYPAPPPDSPCQDFSLIGEISKGRRYRTSTQAAIWDRKILLSLLQDGETGSDFEMHGSLRSDELDEPFLGVWKPAFVTMDLVRGGVWLREAMDILRREGIQPDLTKRPVENRALEFYRDRIAGPVNRISVGNVGLGKLLSWHIPLKIQPWLRRISGKL